MVITADLVKKLREKTNAPMMDCKKALEEAKGDLKKAAEILRRQGLEIAANKQDRAVKEGRIEAYIHMGNKIGVLLEVDCESDFVARNEEFVRFTKNLCMQIAASSPVYIKKEDIPEEVLKAEKKPDDFIKAHCLISQAFIKDPSITVNDYLGTVVAKLGENIVIRRFIRYKVGEK